MSSPAPRYGVRLSCDSCGMKFVAGGYATAAERDAIETAWKAYHTAKHAAGIITSLKDFHAAELQHASAIQTTRQTITSSTYTDVSGGTIASGSFTTGKKYLVAVCAQIDGSLTTAAAKIRVVHGSTAFADSEYMVFPLTSRKYPYFWWVVWTAVSGEAIKLQFANGNAAATTGSDQNVVLAIKLSDDLTEDTGSGGDWKTNETSTSTNLATTDSTTNNATITTTPGVASHDWLVLSKSRTIPASTSRSYATRIVRTGGETTPTVHQEGKSTTLESYVQSLARVYTLAASSQTFTEKSYSIGAASGTRSHSGIFMLNLNKLRNHAFSYPSDASVTDFAAAAGGAFGTTVATASITPDVAGDVWSLGLFSFVGVTQNSGMQARVQLDNSSSTDAPPTQTSDLYDVSPNHDATNETLFAIQSIDNLTAAAHTYDLDGSVSTAATGKGARSKVIMAVTMELPSTGLAQKFVTNETMTLTETPIFNAVRKFQTAETATLTEGSKFLAARIMQMQETMTLSELVVTKAARLFQVVELATLIENFQYVRGRRFQADELLNLTEQLSTKADRKVTVNETLNLLEAFLSNATRKFQAAAESLILTEQPITKAERKILSNEILTIIEQSPITKADRVMISNESLNFIESLVGPIRGQLMIVNENLTYVEAHIMARQALMAVNEIMNMTEDFNSVANRSMVISELMEMAEQPTIMVGERKMVVDEAVILAEQLITAAQRIMPVNETMTIFDHLQTFATRKFQSGEDIGLTENIIALIQPEGTNRVFVAEEFMNLTEATPIFRKGINMVVSENLSFLEGMISIGQRQFQVNEQAIITENLQTLRQVKMLVNETAEFSESSPVFLRVVNMIVNETMNMSETFLSNRGKLFIVSEAMEILESIVTKLELNVGPPPGVFIPLFWGIPSAQPQRRKQQQQRQLQKFKPEEKVRLLNELPRPKIIVFRDYSFSYNIEAPAPSAEAVLQQLKIDAMREKFSEILTPIPIQIAPQRRHLVSRDYTFSYQIRQLVQKDYTFSYHIQQMIEKDYMFAYDIRSVNWNLIASIHHKKAQIERLDMMDRLDQEQEEENVINA